MPLIRDQLKYDPVAERLAAHSTFQFRKFAAFGWFFAIFGTAGGLDIAKSVTCGHSVFTVVRPALLRVISRSDSSRPLNKTLAPSAFPPSAWTS